MVDQAGFFDPSKHFDKLIDRQIELSRMWILGWHGLPFGLLLFPANKPFQGSPFALNSPSINPFKPFALYPFHGFGAGFEARTVVTC